MTQFVQISKRKGGLKTNLSLFMIDHNVVWLDITVHDTLAVTKVQGLQQLEDVVANIVICEAGVQSPEIGVVDSLKN